MTEFVTPQIRTVLKTYQSSATKSLQGPGQSLSAVAAVEVAAAAAAAAAVSGHHLYHSHSTHRNNHHTTSSSTSSGSSSSTSSSSSSSSSLQLSPTSIIKKELISPEPIDLNEITIIQQPPPPELPQPILTTPDTGRGELYETVLEGKPIGCFLLGGEQRLCLPQFLNNVLTDFTLEEINRIFDDLRIFCSQCTPEQLMEFKAAKILPKDVKASGLITRTDAERLCSALLHRSDRTIRDIPKGAISFKVYHKCFGKCEGICTPHLYSYEKPACIMCLECNGMFSPQKFVGHAHRQKENRTCHWGFDSRNWRDYLHVALDIENREKYTKMLDNLRDLEQQEMLNAQRDLSCLKRKAELMDEPIIAPPPCKREPLDIPSKKSKILDESSAYLLEYQRYQHQVSALFYAQCAQREQQLSAFRPWAPKPSLLHLPYSTVAAAAAVSAAASLPYLSQEPPILQNPERVVRHTECERFERTFQPNVALAPRKSILSKEREREKEQREREKEQLEREQQQRERCNSDNNTSTAITNLNETEIIHIKQEIKQERPSSPCETIAQSPEDLRSASPISISNNLHLHRNSRHHHHHYQHNQCAASAAVAAVNKNNLSSSLTTIHHHTTSAPISPEEFSGSNEITSSTSPVPITNSNNNIINNNNGCNRITPPTPPTINQQQHQSHQHHSSAATTAAIIAAINNHQKTADSNNMIVCVPNRIQLSSNVDKLVVNNSNVTRSPTPPSITEQYSLLENRSKMRTIHLQSPPTQSLTSSSTSSSQLSSMLSSVNMGLVNGTTGSGVVIKNMINGSSGTNSLNTIGGAGGSGINSSEFELSTDTDDDSLVGEADSSNTTIPWDITTDILKDAPPNERDKVIHILKMLIHDNTRLRNYAVENAKLQQELRNRDEQIIELQQELQHVQRKLSLLLSTSSSSSSTTSPTTTPAVVSNNNSNNTNLMNDNNSTTNQKISSNIVGGVIAKAESCLTQQKEQHQNDIPVQPIKKFYQKPESEKIKVPLKKSSRRSPEETVVVLNQNLQQQQQQQQQQSDKILTEMAADNNDINTTMSSKNSTTVSPLLTSSSTATTAVSPVSNQHQKIAKSLPIISSNTTNTTIGSQLTSAAATTGTTSISISSSDSVDNPSKRQNQDQQQHLSNGPTIKCE